jgi:hypothetical protein
METVKVIVNIPGLLKKGDILTSAGIGEDFVTGAIVNDSKEGTISRSASIDYYSVCANIPTYFSWVIEDEDIFEVDVEKEAALVDEYNMDLFEYEVVRSRKEIAERLEFFKERAESTPNWEEAVVYNNLIWFVDWLTGKTELLNA